jgi:hypothetical protein
MEIRHLSQISSNSGSVEFLPARPATMFFMYCSFSGSSCFFPLGPRPLWVDSCITCGPKSQSLARATAKLHSVFISFPGNLVIAHSGDSNGCDGPVTAWGPEVDDCIHVSSDMMLQRSLRIESTSLPSYGEVKLLLVPGAGEEKRLVDGETN